MERGRILKLAMIAIAAGAFSGLFGVGGGTVMVPLLIVWLGYGSREATGTSLAAIIAIAAFAAIGQTLYGNVEFDRAALVGLPAVAGVIFGTGLQQRIDERSVTLLFSLLLLVTATKLALG